MSPLYRFTLCTRSFNPSLHFYFYLFIYLLVCFFFQYYVVVTICPNCSSFDPDRSTVNKTSFSQQLSCGQSYIFIVIAITQLEASADNQVTLTLKPAGMESVSNLTVKYFPGDRNFSDFIPGKDWIKFVDRFLLTWDPPKNLAAASIQVQCREA